MLILKDIEHFRNAFFSKLRNNSAGLVTLQCDDEELTHCDLYVMIDWICARNGWGKVLAFEYESQIHETAIIHSSAIIGDNVRIGAYSIIHAGITIENDTRIGEHCIIGSKNGKETVIKKNSTIRSHSVIYGGSKFGESLETGHHVIIRENTKSGNNLRVGSFCDIEGDCNIGDYNRLHGYVHIGKGTSIGHFNWIYSLVTLTNDPLPPSNLHCPVVIEDGVVICVGSTILPGTTLKTGCFVCSDSVVNGNYEDGSVVQRDGSSTGHIRNLVNFEFGIAHPWMNHFAASYPKEVRDRIREIKDKILKTV